MSGDRSEDVEDKESEAEKPEGTDLNDLPTKARREAEDEIMETPAAP